VATDTDPWKAVADGFATSWYVQKSAAGNVTGVLPPAATGPTSRSAHPVTASGASVCATASVFVKVTIEPGTTQTAFGDTPVEAIVTVADVPSVQAADPPPEEESLPHPARPIRKAAPIIHVVACRMSGSFLVVSAPRVHQLRQESDRSRR
jgi:hypothetical protein